MPALRPLLQHAGAILGARRRQRRAGVPLTRSWSCAAAVWWASSRKARAAPTGCCGTPTRAWPCSPSGPGVPILPVGISGAQRYLPRNAACRHGARRITIRVGEPFTVGTG